MASIITDTQNQVFSDSSRLLAPAAVASQVALMSIISVSFGVRLEAFPPLIDLRL
jgi:hypothetical protein